MQIVIQKGLCLWITCELNQIIFQFEMLLIADSLGLHKICILKKTSSKGA